MRDIPGIVWILGIFFLVGGGIFVYSQTGPKPLPPAQDIFSVIDQKKSELQYRRQKLAVGEKQETDFLPYHLTIERLKDIEVHSKIARYLFHVTPIETIHSEKPWIRGGYSLGIIDRSPDDSIGNFQVVSTIIEEKKE